MTQPRIFTVHLHPDKRPLGEHAEFVPEKFEWAAAFLGFLWTGYHRMWWLTAALVVLSVVLGLLTKQGLLSMPANIALQLLQFLLLGFEGNDLRRRKLAARGYQLSDVVVEDSLLHAQQRYLARHASALA